MSRPPERSALLVFARDPVPGRVKTRLIPALGAEGAAALYRQLLQHALAAAAAVPGVSRTLWVDRPDPGSWIRDAAAAHAMALAIQCPGDLGRRMHHALETALATADRAVLIGSDCPGYDARYLDAALRALDGYDAVLGPAADGGYVLVGLRRPAPALFRDIDWGGPRVLEQSRERLRQLGWRWHELPVLQDLDTAEDLHRLGGYTRVVSTVAGNGGEGPARDC